MLGGLGVLAGQAERGFSTLSKAFNGITSTLSSDLGMLKSAGSMLAAQNSKLSKMGVGGMARAEAMGGEVAAAGRLLQSSMGNRLYGYGAGAAAGGMAAADFMNPWGLGWND